MPLRRPTFNIQNAEEYKNLQQPSSSPSERIVIGARKKISRSAAQKGDLPRFSDQWSASFLRRVISRTGDNATKSLACGQLVINKQLFDTSLEARFCATRGRRSEQDGEGERENVYVQNGVWMHAVKFYAPFYWSSQRPEASAPLRPFPLPAMELVAAGQCSVTGFLDYHCCPSGFFLQ